MAFGVHAVHTCLLCWNLRVFGEEKMRASEGSRLVELFVVVATRTNTRILMKTPQKQNELY